MPVHLLDCVHRPASRDDSHTQCPRSRPRRSAPARSWRRSARRDHEWSECRAVARLRQRVSGSSPAAPDRAGTSSRPSPRAGPPTMLPGPAPRSARRSPRPRPEPPHWRGPARRRGAECPRGRSCRRARRSGRQAPPSPCDRASSEGSGSSQVLRGSSPITFTSPSSKAHQKSGSFAPPALPGLDAPTTLSDSRHGRRLYATLRPLPSPTTGLPL